MKHWIETSKIEIASKNLLREIKTFIARGNSYAAKEGETDDLVMALVLIIRMAQETAKYDEGSYNSLLNDGEGDDDDYIDPMPMLI